MVLSCRYRVFGRAEKIKAFVDGGIVNDANVTKAAEVGGKLYHKAVGKTVG